MEFNAIGGSVLPLSTTTDAFGLATTTATIDALAAAIDIEIIASVSGTVVATGSAHAVKAAIVQVYERQSSLDFYGPPSDYFGSFSDSRTNVQQLEDPEAGVSGAATSFVSHNSSLVVHEDLDIYVFSVGGDGTGGATHRLSGEGCECRRSMRTERKCGYRWGNSVVLRNLWLPRGQVYIGTANLFLE